MVVLWFLLQLNRLCEWGNRLLELLEIREANSQVVVDVWLDHLTRLQLEGSV